MAYISLLSCTLFLFLMTFILCWVLLLHELSSSCRKRALLSSSSACASHCGGFSCCQARLQRAWSSAVVARGLSSCSSQALEHRLNSCGVWAPVLCSVWESSLIRDWTRVSCIGRQILYHWATRKAPKQCFVNLFPQVLSHQDHVFVLFCFEEISLHFASCFGI